MNNDIQIVKMQIVIVIMVRQVRTIQIIIDEIIIKQHITDAASINAKIKQII